MVKAPINRRRQVITSDYGERYRNGKMEDHRGIDLRTYNRIRRAFDWIIAPEDLLVTKVGVNGWGDYMYAEIVNDSAVWKRLYFMHVDFVDAIVEGTIIEAGERIGKSQLKGWNTSHHLHFGAYDTFGVRDPKEYLEDRGIEWVYSWRIDD